MRTSTIGFLSCIVNFCPDYTVVQRPIRDTFLWLIFLEDGLQIILARRYGHQKGTPSTTLRERTKEAASNAVGSIERYRKYSPAYCTPVPKHGAKQKRRGREDVYGYIVACSVQYAPLGCHPGCYGPGRIARSRTHREPTTPRKSDDTAQKRRRRAKATRRAEKPRPTSINTAKAAKIRPAAAEKTPQHLTRNRRTADTKRQTQQKM